MQKYQCVKSFYVDKYDDYCIWTGEQISIDENTIWIMNQESTNDFMIGKDVLYLNLETNNFVKEQEIQLLPDTLIKYFKELK